MLDAYVNLMYAIMYTSAAIICVSIAAYVSTFTVIAVRDVHERWKH